MAFEISPRLRILQALTTHLAGMTVDEYGYDLQGCVYRGLGITGDNRGETILSILESPRPDIQRFAGELGQATHEPTWMLLLNGRTQDDPENPSDPSYNFMHAVERRLGRLKAVKNNGNPLYPEEYLLGRLITAISWGPGVVRPLSDEVSASTNFFLPVRLGVAGAQG